jgi:3,4-dihydroxy-2-butanone 4-phosphate synthase
MSSFSPGTAAADTACLAWLCKLAGPAAVSGPGVGHALLDKVMQQPGHVSPLMEATGAQAARRAGGQAGIAVVRAAYVPCVCMLLRLVLLCSEVSGLLSTGECAVWHHSFGGRSDPWS